MLPKIITKKVSNKIIVAMFVLMTISNLAILYTTTSKVHDDYVMASKESLEMLNSAIFQSLRNAMNTGDPEQIAKAEKEAATIKGIEKLNVAKSKKLIEMYSPTDSFTKDKTIHKVFKTKKL